VTLEDHRRTTGNAGAIVIGQVVGIYIDDAILVDGLVEVSKARPIARLGYMDYTFVEKTFRMVRPAVTQRASLPTGISNNIGGDANMKSAIVNLQTILTGDWRDPIAKRRQYFDGRRQDHLDRHRIGRRGLRLVTWSSTPIKATGPARLHRFPGTFDLLVTTRRGKKDGGLPR